MFHRLIKTALWLPPAMLFALAGSGCRPPESVPVETIEEEVEELSTMVHAADPRASLQLVKGFHGIEQNAWRWTMGQFSVTLRPPHGAAEMELCLLSDSRYLSRL